MLTLENLLITQGDFRLAADFRIEEGSRTAIIGPSGAGKSTLLSVIGGFFDPARGRILWNGTDITATQPGNRPLTTLFQDVNLFPHLTIGRNTGLGLTPRRPTPDQRARIREALARVGLEGMEDRKPRELSGGQQSRAALARALLRDRPILLLDEPFAALGPALKADMLDLVAEATADKTLLMVTHDPADARRLCPQTILVADGIAHPPTPTQTLLDDPPQALRSYLGDH